MSAPTKKMSGGLGRGLGALIPQKPIAAIMPGIAAAPSSPENAAALPTGAPLMVPISQIIPNPEQPRSVFKHQELEDLMNSIREHGILQPLTVSPRPEGGYELIAGERRFRASKMLGLESVPVTVREADQNQKLVLALIENIQRENLNALEEARGYQRLMDEFGLTQEEVSKRVGKARSTVANVVRLLTLPSEVQDAIAAGAISAGSARAIVSLPDAKSQIEFCRRLVDGNLSTRDAEAGVRRQKGKVEALKKDPALSGAEEQLRNALGTRVEIRKSGAKGEIAVSFFSDEEYAELLRKMSR